MNALLSWLEGTATAFTDWVVARGIDGLLVLPLVLLVWWWARRRASAHFRAALPWLAIVPLLIPLGGVLPEPLRALSWRGAVERWGAPWMDSPESAARTAGQAGSLRGDADHSQVDERSLAALLAAAVRMRGAAPSSTTSSAIAADDAGSDAVLRPSLRSLLFVAWLAAVATALRHWWGRARRWRRVVAAARPLALDSRYGRTRRVADEALHRGIRLLVSAELPTPLTVGLLRPAILLPAALTTQLADDELRFVLLHELAHVRRGDLWAAFVQRLVRIAWFFHPAPWIAGRLADREREQACDDAALSQFPKPARSACAEAFLKVVEFSRTAASELAGAATLSGDAAQVRSRIMRMVETSRVVRGGMSKLAGGSLALGAVVLVAVLQVPNESAAADDPVVATQQPPLPDLDQQAGKAIMLAADWLLAHQSKGGYWDADGFNQTCGECQGKGGALNDVGVTSLAAIALLRASEAAPDPQARRLLQAAAARTAQFFTSIQDSEDGCIGAKSGQHFMYGHVLGTLALAEIERAAPDAKTAASLQRAVDFLSRARNPYRGWRYSYPPDGDNDSSITSLAEIALSSAMESGTPIDALTIDDGLKFLDEMTDPVNGRTGYHERGSLSAREPDDVDRWPADVVEAITAAMLHARLAEDADFAGTPAMLRGLALIAAKPPRWDEQRGTIDFYYWHHATAAVKAAGGNPWKSWREAVVTALVQHQCNSGHARGSFDPGVDPWGDNGGRIYSTAINLMTLAAARTD